MKEIDKPQPLINMDYTEEKCKKHNERLIQATYLSIAENIYKERKFCMTCFIQGIEEEATKEIKINKK